MQNNFDLKKYLVENKLTPASQKNENDYPSFHKDWLHNDYGPTNEPDGIKIKFLKQNEWDAIQDKYDKTGRISPEEEDLADIGVWNMEGYFDRTYPSLEAFAEFITQQDGGNVQTWLGILNKAKDTGIINIDGSLDEYFSFADKSPEGQRIKNKPQDILNRRKTGQVASGDKEDYKKVVNKQGRLGKDYGNVGPKGPLPENSSFFSNY
jgi:hypothetical protein